MSFQINLLTEHLSITPLWLFMQHTHLFEEALVSSDIAIPMLSVMPTVTPACFASMYTGAMPNVHGITKYEKPVIKTDTLFDAFIRAGKKPAVISTAGDSISCIFLEREMDYFIYETTEECNAKAMKLIENDNYDLVVLYNGNYDTEMHRTGTVSEASINELKQNILTYSSIVAHIKQYWSRHRTIVGFCPDHGCHDQYDNHGEHGSDIAEDMNVIHFYRFIQ